ncbi:MAG TPA: hypothetical protein PKA63_07315 [Oligoflexia bacterium]|nr:hypothetical protein [Oligoflexia bacterium]HMP48458.1 hypothetical protein [Oligoflexia bacterium]
MSLNMQDSTRVRSERGFVLQGRSSSMRKQQPLVRVRDKSRTKPRIKNRGEQEFKSRSRVVKSGVLINRSQQNSEGNVLLGRMRESGLSQKKYFEKGNSSLKKESLNKIHFLFALGIFSVLLGKLFIRLEIMELSYELEGVREEILQHDVVLRELKAKKAVQVNHRQFASEAESRLNLRGTRPQQIRRIRL